MTNFQILTAAEILRMVASRGFEWPTLLLEDVAGAAEFVADEAAAAVDLLLDEAALLSDAVTESGAWLAEMALAARAHARVLGQQLVEVF
jgi:hypothetical protein